MPPTRLRVGGICFWAYRAGIERGIAQLGHGKRDGLARLAAGDWLVHYSPRTSLRDGYPLQAITAPGAVADDEIWPAHEGEFTHGDVGSTTPCGRSSRRPVVAQKGRAGGSPDETTVAAMTEQEAVARLNRYRESSSDRGR
jgi:hypothetical protein